MNVVLDTNVVVSAFLANKKESGISPPRLVLNLAITGRVTVCVCEEILAEYQEVLLRPQFRMNPSDVALFIQDLRAIALHAVPIPCKEPFTDQDDRVFYEVAKAASAILITGNKKHFPSSDAVLSPSEFLSGYGYGNGASLGH